MAWRDTAAICSFSGPLEVIASDWPSPGAQASVMIISRQPLPALSASCRVISSVVLPRVSLTGAPG
jgi:hypothetical protein